MKRRQKVSEEVRISGRISRATGGLFVYVKRCMYPYPDLNWYATTRMSSAGPVRHGALGKTPRAALVNLLAKVRQGSKSGAAT